MKKVLLSLAAIACFAFSANAADFRQDVHVGFSSANFKDGDSTGAMNLGYGVAKVFDNKVFAGVDIDVEYMNPSGTDIYGLGTDLKLGYNVWDKMNVYAIGGYKHQFIDSNAANGWGYGAGVEYPVYKNVIASVDYKTYKMDSSIGDYDYQTVGLSLKYTF